MNLFNTITGTIKNATNTKYCNELLIMVSTFSKTCTSFKTNELACDIINGVACVSPSCAVKLMVVGTSIVVLSNIKLFKINVLNRPSLLRNWTIVPTTIEIRSDNKRVFILGSNQYISTNSQFFYTLNSLEPPRVVVRVNT